MERSYQIPLHKRNPYSGARGYAWDQVRSPTPIHPTDRIDLQAACDTLRAGGVLPLGGRSWQLLDSLLVRPIEKTRSPATNWTGGTDIIATEPDVLMKRRTVVSVNTSRLIHITRSGTTLSGFTLEHRGEGNRTYAEPAVLVENCSDVVLEGLIFTEIAHGIKIVNCSRVFIRNCYVQTTLEFGFIRFINSTNCMALGCSCPKSVSGLEIALDANCHRNVVMGCNLTATGVIDGASLGVQNRPVAGDVSLNVCGAVT